MRTDINEGGGTSVFVVEGDDLGAIPQSHRRLVTAPLRNAFADPVEYYGRIAARCPFTEMKRWLEAVISEGRWELQLHRGYERQWTECGYWWRAESVRGALISPPKSSLPPQFPKTLVEYYSLVDVVDWNGFACAGGLYGATEHLGLEARYGHYCLHGDDVDPKRAFVWGDSPCGDMLLWSMDDQGGWMCHENGEMYVVGTIEETINWIFAELSANRCPEYDYDWD